MKKIRALVVEDSLTIRQRIREVLAADPEIEVVGAAADGKEAIELCRELRPDVVTMDMVLPVMSGLSATEYIMAYLPTPILVVSSSYNRGELLQTYDALAAGAVDVLEKPSGDEPAGEWERRLVATVKIVARIPVITHPRLRLHGATRITRPSTATPSRNRRAVVVAIGASTGGPAAIVEVLRGLPSEFSLPILLVLHISEPFGLAFADWLGGQTDRAVSYPRDGDPVPGATGRVVVAPPGRHLVVRDGKMRLTTDPERHSCRPSVDALFESVATEYGQAAAAVLLTGMGRDGAAGLLEIRRAGGLTIAQDEASSVVYGMPREAALLGAADRILPVRAIGAELAALTTAKIGE
jgi:two-component system chemotaxis response regulator CheB